MSRPRARLLVLALVAVSALAGCATGNPASGTAGPAAGSTLATAGTGSTGSPGSGSALPDALSFSADLVGGGRFDASTLAGKPAVLWFWAAWCPRCQAKAKDVTAAQAAFSGRVNFVGVAGLNSGADSMKRFVADHALGAFPNLADDAGVVWRRFGVTEQEFFVILDAHGSIVHKGPLSTDELRQRISALAG